MYNKLKTPLPVLVQIQNIIACIGTNSKHHCLYWNKFKTPLPVLIQIQNTIACIGTRSSHTTHTSTLKSLHLIIIE